MGTINNQLQTMSSGGADSNNLESLKLLFKDLEELLLTQLSNMQSNINASSNRIDALEAYSRRNCLLFHGIDEKENESVEEVVTLFLANLKIQDWHFNIDIMLDRCHRIGIPRNKPRPIVVKFSTYRHRQVVFVNKKLLKGTGKVIMESITSITMDLFSKAKEEFGKKNAWTQVGHIFSVLPDGKRVKIVDEATLEKFSALPKTRSRLASSSSSRANQPKQQPGVPKKRRT